MCEISSINKRLKYEMSERSKFGIELQSPFEGYILAAELYNGAIRSLLGERIWLGLSEEDKFSLRACFGIHL